MNPKIAAYLISIVIIFGLFYSTYRYGRHVQALKDNVAQYQAIIAQDEEDKKFLFALSEKKRIADEKRSKEGIRLDADFSDLRGVPVTIASACEAVSSPPSSDTNGTSGVADSRNDEGKREIQSALDEYIITLENIGKRCAELNLDAIKANESR